MTDGSNDRDNSEVPDEYLPQKALQRLLEQKKNSTVTTEDKKSKHTQQQGEQDDADLENMLHLHDDEEDDDDESKVKAREEGNEDANDDEVDIDNAGSNLLDSLTTDIAKYHKKVEEKKKSQLKTPTAINKPSAESSSSGLKRSHETDKHNLEDAAAEGGNHDDSITDPSILDDVEDESSSNSSKIPRKRGRKNPIAWSKAEDDAIVYYKEELKYSWKRIEELLERKHSWQAIQMRYLRNHKSRNEDWSRFMEIKLMNEIKKDWEHRWKRISNKLGKDFNSERCYSKTVEICRKMDTDYFNSVFQNKTICQGYENPITDIKDAEAHKKLMLIYMGLDSISYDDYEEVANQIENINEESSKVDALKAAEENVKAVAEANSSNSNAGEEHPEVPTIGNSEKASAVDENGNPDDLESKKEEVVEGETEKQ